MKINATEPQLLNASNHSILQMKIESPRHSNMLRELDSTKQYAVEIKEVKSKRSIQQNKYLWAMLQELERHSDHDMMYWYHMALEESDAKHTYVLAPKDTEKELLMGFRAVRVVGTREYNNKEMYVYKCYIGSSKMNIAEMNQLIDTVLRYCHEHNIETEMFRYE